MATIIGQNGTLEVLGEFDAGVEYRLAVSEPIEELQPRRLSDLRVTFAIPPEVIERARQRLAEVMLAANRRGLEAALLQGRLAQGRIGALAAQARPAPAMIGDPATCPCPICTARRSGWGMIEPCTPADEEAETSLQEVLERCAPAEVLAVRSALRAGLFEGTSARACLLGIVARCRGIAYEDVLRQCGRTAIELWVIAHVHLGMTPATDARAALFDAWLTAWLEAHTLELPEEQPERPPSMARAAPPVYRQRPPLPYLADPDWRPRYLRLE